MYRNIPGFRIYLDSNELIVTFDTDHTPNLPDDEAVFRVAEELNVSAVYLEAKITEICAKAFKAGFDLARQNPHLQIK